MSSEPQGPGWWQASDLKWYPPELAPASSPPPPPVDSSANPPPAGAALAQPVAPPSPPSGPTPYQAPPADPSGQRPAAVGDAFNWAWLKFQRNVGEIILLAIAALVVIAVIVIAGFFLLTATLFSTASSIHCGTDALGQTTCNSGSAGIGFLGFVGISVLLFTLNIFVSFLVQMWFIRASLILGYGEKLEMKKMLSTENIGSYVLGALLVSIAVLVGSFLCFVPGLIVLFFSSFFGFFILDKKMSAVDGIRASFRLVNKNLATMIGFFIASYIALVLGYLLCGIGIIVAMPVVVIASGFMYRRLQGEPVAA